MGDFDYLFTLRPTGRLKNHKNLYVCSNSLYQLISHNSLTEIQCVEGAKGQKGLQVSERDSGSATCDLSLRILHLRLRANGPQPRHPSGKPSPLPNIKCLHSRSVWRYYFRSEPKY